MRCLVGEAWRGATSVSIKKEADSRPSEEIELMTAVWLERGYIQRVATTVVS